MDPRALSPGTAAPAQTIVLATHSDLVWEPLAGRPLLAWTVAAFERTPAVGRIILVVAPEHVPDARSLASSEAWRKTRIVAGPAAWRDALQTGLDALGRVKTRGHNARSGLVVVHEGARPLVTPELIAAGIAAATETGAAAAGEPVKETIKRVRDGLIMNTLPREHLVRVQTPLVFSAETLRAALARAPIAPSPPQLAGLLASHLAGQLVSLALATGRSVSDFAGSPDNLAVHAPDDLAVAEALLQRRMRNG